MIRHLALLVPAIAALALLLAVHPATGQETAAQDTAIYGRDRPVDVLHVRVELNVTEEGMAKASFEGLVEHHIRPRVRGVERVVFDAVDMEILEVELRDRSPTKANFSHDGERLNVELVRRITAKDEIAVRIRYRVNAPLHGLYSIPASKVSGLPAAFYSHSEPQTARYWVPCIDEPQERFTTEISVTVPPGYQAIASGVFQESLDNPDGTSNWTWHNDVPFDSHLMGFAVSRWVQTDLGEWRGRPLPLFVHAGYEERVRHALQVVPEALEYYQELLGVPPAATTYLHATIPEHHHGGMEHSTYSLINPRLLDPEQHSAEFVQRNYIVHMLGHLWFAGNVVYRSVPEAWLNEGFATYLHFLWTQRASPTAFEHHMWDIGRQIVRAERSGSPLVQRHLEDVGDVFGWDGGKVYWKGAWVLHMLRLELGDDVFWRGVRTYLERHHLQAVETSDLRRAFEETSARSLEQFFAQWVEGAGYPELKVTSSWEPATSSIRVLVEQSRAVTPDAPLFSFPLNVCIPLGGPTVQNKVMQCHDLAISGPRHEFHFNLEAPPLQVVIDPHQRLLKKLEETKSPEMWRNQALQGMTMIARLNAVMALAELGDTTTLKAVLNNSERTPQLRREVAGALGRVQTEEAEAALLETTAAPDEVTAAIYSALGLYPVSDRAHEALLAVNANAALEVEAAAVTVLGAMRTTPARATRTLERLKESANGRTMVRQRAIHALTALNDPAAWETIQAAAAPTGDPAFRRQAIRAVAVLGRHDAIRDQAFTLLRQGLYDSERDIRLASTRALGRLGDQRAAPDLRRLVESGRSTPEREAARKALEGLK